MVLLALRYEFGKIVIAAHGRYHVSIGAEGGALNGAGMLKDRGQSAAVGHVPDLRWGLDVAEEVGLDRPPGAHQQDASGIRAEDSQLKRPKRSPHGAYRSP